MRKVWLPVAAALVGGCGESAVGPVETGPNGIRPAVVAHVRERFVATLPNPCAGESVQVEGIGHTLVATTSDGAGGFHVQFHFNAQGVHGTGVVSGDRYRMVEVNNVSLNVAGPLPAVLTVVVTLVLVGEGAADDFRTYATMHVTVNAKGETTALFDRVVETECVEGERRGRGSAGES